MDPSLHPAADVNLSTTGLGYNGYLWTVDIHYYLGDTALHFSLRQRKILTTSMLLLLGADIYKANAQHVTPGACL